MKAITRKSLLQHIATIQDATPLEKLRWFFKHFLFQYYYYSM